MINFLAKFTLTNFFEGLIFLTKLDKTNILQIFTLYIILVMNIIMRQLIIFKIKKYNLLNI